MKENRKIRKEIFDIAIFVKLIAGFFDLLIAIMFSTMSMDKLILIIQKISSNELVHDPTDFTVNFLINVLHHFGPGTKTFLVAYFLIHACINVLLFVTIWKKEKMAYPFAIALLCVLTIYQVIRFMHTHSLILLGLTIIDIILIYFVIDEYKHFKLRIKKK